MDMVTSGEKLEFYSDTISYGSSGSPKEVYIRGYNFVHSIGVEHKVPFQIILELDT